ncbi:MAG: helix-turn-helix domain-containing protein [bacterium]|nr:helix-turn-helix domain-containing protein [bacterium]
MSTATLQQVLTLEDAATFLRLPEATIERRAALGEIPGRKIQGTWRFLLSALEDWLRTPDQRSVLLSQAGALADDESLEELLAQVYAARGRPEVDPDGA